MKNFHLLLFLIVLITACSQQSEPKSQADYLQEQLLQYGHRNWIVVVDAAYPLQSKPGIKTILSNKSHEETLKEVLHILRAQKHVKPNIFLDRELDFIEEKSAPGISKCRKQLMDIIDPFSIEKVPHESLIQQLDSASQLFEILVIKTDMDLPYTSVFLQLDCKYWNEHAEEELRNSMK